MTSRPRLPAAFLCALSLWLAPAPVPAGEPALVGGPCRYEIFPGRATIVSVGPSHAAPDGGAAPHLSLAVAFTFASDAPITGVPLHSPGATHFLTLLDGRAPGPRFTAKYSLAPGRVLPCELRVIRQGACTPVVFTFPGIDLGDYFEALPP